MRYRPSVLVAVLVLVAAACSSSPPRVTLYGDSLGVEARDELAGQLHGEARFTDVVQGGAALCDALPQISQDLERRRPAIALIQFSGNNITDCMAAPDGSPLEGADLVAKYASDATEAVAMLRKKGVIVYLVGSPLAERSDVPAQVNAAYQILANQWATKGGGVTYVDAGAAVLTPQGTYTDTLPCLPTETAAMGCNGGQIVVRAPDGIHFCPTQSGGTERCPVYSSGAHRFAAAMAGPVLAELRG